MRIIAALRMDGVCDAWIVIPADGKISSEMDVTRSA